MINITKTISVINPDDKVFDYNAFLVRRKSDGDFLALIFCTKYKDIYMQINKEGDFVVYTIDQTTKFSSLFDNTDMFEFVEVEDYTLNVDVAIKEV